MWWVSLWEALIVVSQKWSFPTALPKGKDEILALVAKAILLNRHSSPFADRINPEVHSV